MGKFTAIANLTLEVNANSEDEAVKAIQGEIMDRLIATATKDSLFDLFVDVVDVYEMEKANG